MSGEPAHGTHAGYRWHIREMVPSCEACRAANAERQRQFRAAKPGAREADRAWNKTRHRALEKLAAEYPRRFLELLAQERDGER